jgi:hypothetical protein
MLQLGVGTESGMFSPELFLSFVERIYGIVEILQVFLILAHHVFGKVQKFLRGESAGRHVGLTVYASELRSACTKATHLFSFVPGFRET